jgi:acyl carrier protein
MSGSVAEKVIEIIARKLKSSQDEITLDTTFYELGLDSLEGFSLVSEIEEEFRVNILDEDTEDMQSVRDIVEGIEKQLA